MTTIVILGLIVAAVVLLVRTNRQRKDSAAEAYSAANPLDPRVDLVWRRGDRPPRELRRAEGAVRAATPQILDLLHRHGELPQLIVHSDSFVFYGLLVVTSRRTLLIGGMSGSCSEVAHDGAETAIRVSGPNDPSPIVEIRNGGRIIQFGPSIDEAHLICGVADCWIENPGYVGHPGVIASPRLVHIPDDFYVDLLCHVGRPVTGPNIRSLHERVGMMLYIKAFNLFRESGRDDAAQQLMDRAGRPHDDRQLPIWPTRVLETWAALDPKVAYLGSFALAQVRSMLLESASTNGYFSGDPRRPLSMWHSEWYENDGRGVPARGHPSVPV